ncbi:sodium channel and clathrin linker 1 [Hypanus sabinus]|uniref:sodium channel and clathrin linker 1 n=1 Tax=Hypanus sabinus TaxID=79690 RepID=UPI0028C502E7|nr:sodium channel and clathrin linker 1 [Hypanus sabinus]XP_059821217.1 sodium channel and clathrin linker 1 [Hypanus sabinus]
MNTPEVDFLRDQVQRLNAVLAQYQAMQLPSSAINEVSQLEEHDPPAPWLVDKCLLAPLVAEYDKQLQQMNQQLNCHQVRMNEMKLKLEVVVKENERLHAELQETIEKQLESLPAGASIGDVDFTEGEVVQRLKKQLQLANKEKELALELHQSVSQQLDQMQQMYHDRITVTENHVFGQQQETEQLAHFQQLAQQLKMTNQKLKMTNQQFIKTVTDQNLELEQNHRELRKAKMELRTANLKIEEMNKMMQSMQEDMQRNEQNAAAALGREEASDKRLQQLQSAITQCETRLRAAVQTSEQLQKEKISFEVQVRELREKYTQAENEKYVAVAKVRESMQLLEEANLKKDQILLREKQKDEEVVKVKEAMVQLVQEVAAQIKKEVENVRKQSNVQISRLTEELSDMQMNCEDKQGQIERARREKRAVEEELEKMYRNGASNEEDRRKIDELHQRCLNAERSKDGLQISLQAAQNKIRKLEMNHEEEMFRCKEMVQKLQSSLENIRGDCDTVSEERLRLQRENEQIRKEMEELKKVSLDIQRKAKQQVATLEHECSVKERGFEIQLQELEDTNRNSNTELKRLLAAQQKATSRWRDEARKLTEAFEVKQNNLKTELSRQKQHSQELGSQLDVMHEKMAEYEKQLSESQEKINRLQRRLTHSENRAATASQKLSTVTRRKVDTLFDLESILNH